MPRKGSFLPPSGFPPRDKSWKPVVCLSGLWGGLASNYNATLNPLMKSRVQILSVNINSDEAALKLMSSRRRIRQILIRYLITIQFFLI